jgi:hypothetical protein
LSDAEVRRGWQLFYDGVKEFYIGLVQAARATGKIQTTDPEQAVDFMLATMEGIKLQAHYNPRLCNPDSEKAIVQSLKRALGFPDRHHED